MDKESLLSEVRDKLSKQGPFFGPRGGKWADAGRRIPWKERKIGEVKAQAKKVLSQIKAKAGNDPEKQKHVKKASHLITEIYVSARADRKGIGRATLTVVRHALDRLLAINELLNVGSSLIMSDNKEMDLIKKDIEKVIE